MVKLSENTFVRFALLGLINTAVGATIMFTFYNLLHLSYWFSSAANYLVGGILNYILNMRYTFHYEGSRAKSIARFALNILVCYLIAYGLANP